MLTFAEVIQSMLKKSRIKRQFIKLPMHIYYLGTFYGFFLGKKLFLDTYMCVFISKFS